jgi:hypothetical protein
VGEGVAPVVDVGWPVGTPAVALASRGGLVAVGVRGTSCRVEVTVAVGDTIVIVGVTVVGVNVSTVTTIVAVAVTVRVVVGVVV